MSKLIIPRTKDDYQALHHAAKNNYDDIVHLLLIQNNSDPNVRIYEEGPTALHIAADTIPPKPSMYYYHMMK